MIYLADEDNILDHIIYRKQNVIGFGFLLFDDLKNLKYKVK